MMQGDTLQQCPIEAALTMAAEEGATGGIDVHAGVHGTILLDDGHVSYAVLHDSHVRPDLGATAEPGTEVLESSIRQVVGTLLDTTSGEWTFTAQHPMTFRVPPRHRSRYDVRRLLDDLAPGRDLGPLDAWSGTLLEALPVDGREEFVLDADMWTVISSLIEAQSIRSIADTASLEPMRLALALARLQVRGLFRARADVSADSQPAPEPQPVTRSEPVDDFEFDPVSDHDARPDPEPVHDLYRSPVDGHGIDAIHEFRAEAANGHRFEPIAEPEPEFTPVSSDAPDVESMDDDEFVPINGFDDDADRDDDLDWAPVDDHESELIDDHDFAPINGFHYEPDQDDDLDSEPLTVPAEWSTPMPEQPTVEAPVAPGSSIQEALARMTTRVDVEDEEAVEERRLRSIDLLPEALRPVMIRDPEPAPEPEPTADDEETADGSNDRRGALSRLISSLRR